MQAKEVSKDHMSDFIQFIRNHHQEIVSLLVVISSIIVATFSIVSAKITSAAIKKAKSRGTFTVCPHCHKAIPLSDLDFRLPDGSIDNDLNGVPDVKEKGNPKQ